MLNQVQHDKQWELLVGLNRLIDRIRSLQDKDGGRVVGQQSSCTHQITPFGQKDQVRGKLLEIQCLIK